MVLDWMPILRIGDIQAEMLNVDDYLWIRLLHRDGLSIRQIARRLGHGRDTIRKVITELVPRGYTQRRPVGYPKLGPFLAVIDRILEQDQQALPKQRHTAARLYVRLRDERPGGKQLLTPLAQTAQYPTSVEL